MAKYSIDQKLLTDRRLLSIYNMNKGEKSFEEILGSYVMLLHESWRHYVPLRKPIPKDVYYELNCALDFSEVGITVECRRKDDSENVVGYMLSDIDEQFGWYFKWRSNRNRTAGDI